MIENLSSYLSEYFKPGVESLSDKEDDYRGYYVILYS